MGKGSIWWGGGVAELSLTHTHIRTHTRVVNFDASVGAYVSVVMGGGGGGGGGGRGGAVPPHGVR
jgi:hypothetical protein